MSKTTDERGRIHLPKDLRERFETEYRIVELPNYVTLLPVAEDPIEAVGDELAGKSVEELKTETRQKSRGQISSEREEQ